MININSFKDKKIGVIGDLMLDQFISGSIRRLSPGTPVPVLHVEKEDFALGGAGNVVANIAALGKDVSIVGLIGSDAAGARLMQVLRENEISALGLIADNKRPTIQKIRIIGNGEKIIRVDREDTKEIDESQQKKIIDFVALNIKDWDCVVFSDYAKGILTQDMVKDIIKLADGKPVIGDIKPKNAHWFKDITLVTPNEKEAVEIAGTEDIEKAGKIIQEKLNCSVLLTQGEKGMTLFEKDEITSFSAQAKAVADVAGAGDTVVAAFSLGLASGLGTKECAEVANCAAAIAVEKQGTTVVRLDELKQRLKNG